MRLGLEFFDEQENVESLKAEILEMEKIVAALLEAEWLNSRHAELSRSQVNVGSLVESLLEDFFSRDKDRIRIQMPDRSFAASLDEARITLLLKNLVSNALRYSKPEDGPVDLIVSKDGEELVIVVKDCGPGLSAEQVAHIGEPFYRGDPSRARESGGTGLGLYLGMLVAKAHGGSLKLLPASGQGATFEVRLPLIEP